MKAVVFHAIDDIRLDEVAEPQIQQPTDAIVRLTAAAFSGTDRHLVRGNVGGMRPGTILGHEGVGIVEALGADVRNLQIGDRVVIPATIACGNCVYCRAGYYAQCDVANPNGPQAGTAFFGGPADSGPFHGLQAEKARIPFAHIGLVKLPSEVSDDQAILLSDSLPTGYFAVELAEVTPGDSVAVFGCGPVGQFAIASAKLRGAARVFAIDKHQDRLRMARQHGAETIHYQEEDPVETLLRLTGGIGVSRAIDAAGVDAECAHDAQRPAQPTAASRQPNAGPSQALMWAVQCLAKAGTLAIVGVYPPAAQSFPIGLALGKNLTLSMGNCHHRKYIPRLIELILSKRLAPAKILTQIKPIVDAIAAFEAFNRRENGWIKVELQPQKHRSASNGSEERISGEQRLDEAIEESFPASDPVAMVAPRRS
ncbi:MAG: zinc-dependent alcohol dehydrogenase [Pseudomonas sp.]